MAMATGTERPDKTARGASVPSVLAIVVTHNGRRWLTETLVGLNTQDYKVLDVLVVDDASEAAEPRLKRVAKRHLKRRRWGYLRTPRPLGYGGAINWALARVKTDADLLLFLHDDAALEPDAVRHMVRRILDDDKTAIVGPKIVSWDDPQRLEEIGMAADRFGYPYKGLEEDEIDLGQHDVSAEVFYVTSTCMLVRHESFKRLRGWDARLRAFAEDLDLCWRARLEGNAVRVEPRAKARHAIALAKGERSSPFEPARYYIRRNRLRTVFKNASTLRLVALVPQFFLLTLIEMLAFIVLRQPREILNLGRALGWNILHLPQSISERRRVQKRRTVSDTKLRRLTVRESTRVRSYVGQQRERLDEAWGRRAEVLARRSSEVRLVSTQFKGWLGVAVVFALLALILGFRHIWWSPPVAVGELLPFPDRVTGVLRAFLSPWRTVGLGQESFSPPAFALLGVFPILTLGAMGAAQKLLILVLGLTAFIGGYRLVSDVVDRTGRFAAGAVYMLGAVGYAGIRGGALAALVFGSAAPFVLLSLIRISGWVRPAAWKLGPAIARTGMASAISAAFVPGSLFLYVLVALLLTIARAVFVQRDKAVRGLAGSLAGLAVGWLLLLPWSASWLEEGGTLRVLWDEATWRTYSGSFEGHGVLSTVLGQMPEGPVFSGLALPLLGFVAVLASSAQRKKLALALWGIVVMIGWVATLVSNGTVRSPVASPLELGVLASVAFAALVGLAIGGFKMDLRRQAFGWVHWLVLAALASSVFLFAGGLGPALYHGDWASGGDDRRAHVRVMSQVHSILAAEVNEVGAFRTLWVGSLWAPPEPSAARPFSDAFVTGARGQRLTDLFPRRTGRAEEQFRRVIDSVRAGTTDRGGALLGAFNVHAIVLEKGAADEEVWLAQRDLAILRTEEDYFVLENAVQLARAGIYSDFPAYVRAVEENDPSITAGRPEVEIDTLRQVSSSHYRDEETGASGLAFLAESADPGWTAELGGEALVREAGGWGNAWTVPERRERTDLEISYPRPLSDLLWFLFLALAWIVVLGASFSRTRRNDSFGRAGGQENEAGTYRRPGSEGAAS